MRRVPCPLWWLPGVLAGVLLGPGCQWPDRCEASVRCVGEGQYEGCSDRGSEGIRRHLVTCAAPNAACVDLREDSVQCVYAPAARCDATFVDHCEGSLRVYCDESFGWAQAVDCRNVQRGGPGCHVDMPTGKAVCD